MFDKEEVMAQEEEEDVEELVVIALSKLKYLCQCGGDQDLFLSTELTELAKSNPKHQIFLDDGALVRWAWPLLQSSNGTSLCPTSIAMPPFAHLKGRFVKYWDDDETQIAIVRRAAIAGRAPYRYWR